LEEKKETGHLPQARGQRPSQSGSREKGGFDYKAFLQREGKRERANWGEKEGGKKVLSESMDAKKEDFRHLRREKGGEKMLSSIKR